MKIPLKKVYQWSWIVKQLVPELDLEQSARMMGAFKRSRKITSASDLLHLVFIYSFCGLSLRESSAWAYSTGKADISDVALLKRFKKCIPWLHYLLNLCLKEKSKNPKIKLSLFLTDATHWKAEGALSPVWRVHSRYDVRRSSYNHFLITSDRIPESLEYFPWHAGDTVIADAIYGKEKQVRLLVKSGSDYILRTGYRNCCFHGKDGSVFNVFEKMRSISEQKAASFDVYIGSKKTFFDDFISSRLIIFHKDNLAVKKSVKRIKRQASKKCYTLFPKSIEATKYIFLLTSFPKEKYTDEDILNFYRFRWQIELAFKRLKNFTGFHSMKARDPQLVQCCLYAKLLMALLIDFLTDWPRQVNREDFDRVPSLWRFQKVLTRNLLIVVLGSIRSPPYKIKGRYLWEASRKRKIQSYAFLK